MMFEDFSLFLVGDRLGIDWMAWGKGDVVGGIEWLVKGWI